MKMHSISRWLLLPLFLLVLTSFSAEAYTASGTYTYSSGIGPGPLALDITASDFLCDGFVVETITVPIVSLTETTLLWQDKEAATTTLTRPAGTAGDITGTWHLTDADTGSVYELTFNADGTVSLVGDISRCYVEGPPTITSFSPATAMAGNLITITGSNFSPILANNTVSFNGVSAVVTGARPSQLFVVVPAGAASGTISVTNAAGTATSSNTFTVAAGIPAATINWGNVHHRLDSDGTQFDALDVGINSYATTLAGTTLTVAGPNGFSYTFTDADINSYINGLLALYTRYRPPGPPLAAGVYTFTLNDGQGTVSHRVDTHVTAAAALPQVDSATIQQQRRADGSYRISWAPVNATTTYYYRLRINRNDSAESFVYDSTRAMITYADVAQGILFDDSTYKVRVETVDSSNVELATNRSLSAWKLFSPLQDDYDANRLQVIYSVVNNRYNPSGVISTDVLLGVNTPAAVSSLQLLNGAGAVVYTFNVATDKSGTDFYKNFTTPLTPGAYTLRFVANGITHNAYVTLTSPVAYPTPDPATMQAEYLSNGNIRFSWANVNHSGALYYRLSVNDTSTGAFITSPRKTQTYVDMAAASLGNLATKQWRVEVYDSDQVYTQRNRANSTSINLVPVAYDPASPAIDYYSLLNLNNWNISTSAEYSFTPAAASGVITQGRVDGPGGFTRNLSQAVPSNHYRLTETGSPATGLYTYTAEGNAGKKSVRYKYQPAPYAIPAVDYHTFQVDSEPNGATRISWAPVLSNLPLWYALELWNASTMSGITLPDNLPASAPMQQVTVSIPAQYMQGQVSFRIYALDSNDESTINNFSQAVMVTSQAGLNYAGLTDADNDGYAANIDPNDNNPNIDPFRPGFSGTPGDCDTNGTVIIAEVQSAINMFLGINPVQLCVDVDNSGAVSIAEVQKVINGFLGL